MCNASNCRDRVSNCSSRAQDGICQNNSDWAQQYCAQTCGCVEKTCVDNYIPGLDARDAARSATLETEDAEHSSEMAAELPIHEAIKYLDPSSILSQFSKVVRKTLKNQMCIVPDANTRIIAANDLLKVLAHDEDAQVNSQRKLIFT